MTISEFLRTYPQYGFDFSVTLQSQPRVYDPDELAGLPAELTEATAPRGRGGRGRPILSQTRTHYQCRVCLRVLRNDLFYTPPKLTRINRIFSSCIACTRTVNAERYTQRADEMRNIRLAAWSYLAPRCQLCGFDKHSSAMDMHHLASKEGLISELVTFFAQTPNAPNGEKLLREAGRCIPLCANCHRMLHAGVIHLPAQRQSLPYNLAELMRIAEQHLSAR